MSLLKADNLSRFSHVTHGFSTRHLGVDYARIGKEVHILPDRILTVKQVHSNKVYHVTRDEKIEVEADSLVTGLTEIFVAIRTADCVPILVYDPCRRVVAAIHAGWRGLISGVIEETFKVLKNSFNCRFSELIVALGPALCPGCFEIGPDVASPFKEKFGDRLTISPGRGGRSFVDLRKGCCLVLEEQGLPSESIEVLSHCTACEPELFYSYRKGDHRERMLAFIGIECFIDTGT